MIVDGYTEGGGISARQSGIQQTDKSITLIRSYRAERGFICIDFGPRPVARMHTRINNAAHINNR